LREANAWKTKASISIPMPVTAQPMSSGPGAALPAIWEGRAKMPLPIIDPTTIAVRAARPRPAFVATGRISVVGGVRVSDIVVSLLGRCEVVGVAPRD
jgi:hypothetical protein